VEVGGRCVRKCEAGGGLRVENHENERGSSFSGTPCETGVQDDGER